MKARLSTGTKRPFACFRDDLHEEMAIAEARSILAAEEPEPTHAEMIEWGGRTARIHTTLEALRRTAGASPYSLRDEIVAALRAFDTMSIDDVATLQTR